MALVLYKWLLLSLFALPGENKPVMAGNTLHPFYVSVLEVNHNSQSKALEVSAKIFTEDLEEILRKNYKTTVDLANAKNEVQNNKLVNDYLVKHLSFAVDGRAGRMDFVGFEIEDESVYAYFELANIPSLKKLDISNSILHDFKPEQINIMHITVNGNRKSYKLDFPNTKASFFF